MNKNEINFFINKALKSGNRVLKLAPTWVPRAFLIPGRRIKLHPDDIYALGAERGGIDERWFASTTQADNGPSTPPDEGLSYIVHEEQRVLLREAIEVVGEEIIGETMTQKYGGWKVYAKFFDNMEPIPHHLHQQEKHAKLVGREGKPESYYFPPQLNSIQNSFPYTFFGLEPGTSKQNVIDCLKNWDKGDNGILDFSKAIRLKSGTGWLLPAGILHAPGTLVTFEVQWASDVLSMFQSMVFGKKVDRQLLVKDVPKEKTDDFDYMVGMLDWERNLVPNFKERFYLEPIPVKNTEKLGYHENWIIYGQINGKDYFSAKELTIPAKTKATVKDNGAHGTIVIQGRGKIAGNYAESPIQIRYGELTSDEFFITNSAATEGIEIENTGLENLVILKYFGPETNPDMPKKEV
ncbi:MAG: hypothetical protein M1371_07280 [Actinobacteria bacterium]|nr:hypothetical protein [Actinomycetota bacterium]